MPRSQSTMTLPSTSVPRDSLQKWIGVLGERRLGAADVPEDVVPDDPVGALVAVDAADVVLRADAGRVLEEAALDEPRSEPSLDAGRVGDLQHLLAGVDEADVVDEHVVRVLLALDLDGVVTDPAHRQVGRREAARRHEEHVRHAAVHAGAAQHDGVPVAREAADGDVRAGDVQELREGVGPVRDEDRLRPRPRVRPSQRLHELRDRGRRDRLARRRGQRRAGAGRRRRPRRGVGGRQLLARAAARAQGAREEDEQRQADGSDHVLSRLASHALPVSIGSGRSAAAQPSA